MPNPWVRMAILLLAAWLVVLAACLALPVGGPSTHTQGAIYGRT